MNIIVTLIECTSKTELFDEKVDFTSVICTTQTYDIESKFSISKICKEQCLLENQKFYLQHVKMFSCFLFKTAEIKICLFYIVQLNVYVFRWCARSYIWNTAVCRVRVCVFLRVLGRRDGFSSFLYLTLIWIKVLKYIFKTLPKLSTKSKHPIPASRIFWGSVQQKPILMDCVSHSSPSV